MTQRKFAIISVTISDNTDADIRKVLSSGVYTLNNTFDDEGMSDFFGKNISVSAIVGKNGCGKSTLMDIIIMIVNNFTYKMMYDKWVNEDTYRICYVQRLWAKLTFRIGDEVGIIACADGDLCFTYGNFKYFWGDSRNCPQGYDQQNGSCSDKDMLALTEEFFYSIVVNYSIHAFIDSNYRRHLTLHSDGDEGNHAWINALFHKNDGYREPINISPFRERGIMDIGRENYLNQQRMASLMVYCDHNAYPFMQEYGLRELSYMYDPHLFFNKFNADILGITDKGEREEVRKYYDKLRDCAIKTFRNSLSAPRSLASDILSKYSISYDAKADDDFLVTGYMYLVYKVIDISGTYPSYKDFSDISDIKNVFARIDTLQLNKNAWTTKDTKELIDKLEVKSHITLKLRQTINFIRGYKTASKASRHLITTDGVFNYEAYRNGLGLELNYTNLQDIMEVLPPPFYYGSTIFELRNVEPWKGPAIDMRNVSAGQMQYLHVMSNIVYHMFNLLSIVEKDRVKYRYVNLMLDEIELCFHPEYQRRFLHDLISLLTHLKLNEKFGINIIACTHSPFILSDIPLGNVLFLENGENVTSNMKQKTFGANVNELLAESFFLCNGFMGEFAASKIRDLILFLQGSKTVSVWTDDTALAVIREIGEPVIVESLLSLMSSRTATDDDVILRWHEEQARLLREKKGDSGNA